MDKPSPYQSMLAGGTAGGLEALVTYPTEYVKTRQQLSGPQVSSPISILVNTIRSDGIKPIYTGAGAFCVSNSSKAAVRFVTFDLIRNELPRNPSTGKPTAIGTMFAGLCAGIAESVTVLTPGENLKTKLIDGQKNAAANNTTTQALSRIVAESGIRGLYRGIVPVTLKQSANSIVRFTSYSYLVDGVTSALRREDLSTSIAPAIAGGLAGIVTVYATMPFDNIKTKLQSIEGQRVYVGSIDCLHGILKTSGLRGLWKGTAPRLVRLSFAGMISFSIYEHVIAWTRTVEQRRECVVGAIA